MVDRSSLLTPCATNSLRKGMTPCAMSESRIEKVAPSRPMAMVLLIMVLPIWRPSHGSEETFEASETAETAQHAGRIRLGLGRELRRPVVIAQAAHEKVDHFSNTQIVDISPFLHEQFFEGQRGSHKMRLYRNNKLNYIDRLKRQVGDQAGGRANGTRELQIPIACHVLQ